MARASLPSPSLDALIGWLYDAAVDTRPWDGVASALAATFGADSAVLKVHGDPGAHLLELTDNLRVAPKDQAWAEHWHRNDLWVDRTLALGTSGIVTSQQLLADSQFERSGFYQDWNRHLGIYHMIGSVFPVAGGLSGVVGIHRPRGRSVFGAMDRRRMATLLPHMQRAMRLRSQLAPARLATLSQTAAFERLQLPAMLLDGDRRLLYANAQGEALLRACSGLALRAGRVTTTDPALASRWRQLVQQAQTATGGAMLLHRAGRAPLSVLLAPLRETTQANAAVLVLLRDPAQQKPSLQLLRDLFGLTATEARVAAAIAEGLAPEQIALQLSIGIGTARSHLRQVLAKTGTHRQNELAALITRSVAMMHGETVASACQQGRANP